MKTIRTLVATALAVGGLAVGLSAEAASHSGGGGGGGWSGGHGGWSGGGGGSHGGSWHGGGSGHGGGYWHGGGYYHGGYWHGHGYYPYYATAVGFYFGAPWVWGPWYWGGYPYDGYYGGYAPYSDYPAAPAAAYPDGVMQAPQTTEVDPNAPGAPTQAPAYMNYCVSAKAYFPKVTSCPEGWKFVPTH